MMMISRLGKSASASLSRRGFATRLKRNKFDRLSPEVLDALPVFFDEEETPAAVPGRKPVTSAHSIDVAKQQVSTADSAKLSPNGSIVHGTFGELPKDLTAAIPLEYLALLRPAAEGCAAIRVTLEKAKAKKGTLLVYGAGQANGLAATQVASAAGHAVVAVVGGEHSGNDLFMECVKGLVKEPGTAVPEEFALSKKAFADLVTGVSIGDDGTSKAPSPEEYLRDFKKNFIDQCAMYPDTRPAAVAEKHLQFQWMEKDREFWDQNMQAYLEQFPEGAPPIDESKLNAYFTVEQYEIFRKKFWRQTSAVISGDDLPFSPPHILQRQLESPEVLEKSKGDIPYVFSIVDQFFPPGTEPAPGGPILGAIICVTPSLKIAADRVASEKTLHGKGEALQFLTQSQKAAFGAACSVAAQARKAGAPITVIGGSLPDLDAPPKVTDADVKAALQAMDVQEDGSTALNYFVQTYRAADFPFYADYAVHRASEVLAGPRQIIVTK